MIILFYLQLQDIQILLSFKDLVLEIKLLLKGSLLTFLKSLELQINEIFMVFPQLDPFLLYHNLMFLPFLIIKFLLESNSKQKQKNTYHPQHKISSIHFFFPFQDQQALAQSTKKETKMIKNQKEY